MTETELKFWGALAAAIVSLIVAVVSHFSSRANQREIEKVKGSIADANAERNARRDYQYDARKRLYEQCGPLLLQLSEAAEGGYYRVMSLASRAREGYLKPGPSSFLRDDYYRLSTIYRLCAPAAVLRLIQRRLTLVDLSLDRTIHRQYTLARQAFFAFGEEFMFARLNNLRYEPFDAQADNLAKRQPAIYARQGLPLGVIETVLDAMIDAKESRVRTYAECEQEYGDATSQIRHRFDDVSFLLYDFHPRLRPVFWQMLVAQACLYRVLANPYDLDDPNWSWKKLTDLDESESAVFDWRNEVEKEEQPPVLQLLRVASRYFEEHLAPRLRRVDAIYSAEVAKAASSGAT